MGRSSAATPATLRVAWGSGADHLTLPSCEAAGSRCWNGFRSPSGAIAMITFRVDDMTCGHCVATIKRAVNDVDAGAGVDIDLAAHRVRITPVRADEQALRDAIR